MDKERLQTFKEVAQAFDFEVVHKKTGNRPWMPVREEISWIIAQAEKTEALQEKLVRYERALQAINVQAANSNQEDSAVCSKIAKKALEANEER